MGSISKEVSLLFVVFLMGSILIVAESALAQSIPKPSTPEFTITLISSPPDIDFVNKTIELSIKNQPSFPNYGFFYNVRTRINDGNWSLQYPTNDVPSQSSGEYTNLSYPSGQPVVEYQYYLGGLHDLFAGDKVDFQVQAMIGSIHRIFNPNATNQLEMYPYVFTGESSGWSNTQTITIPANSTDVSPSPAQHPTINTGPEPPPQTEPFLTTLAVASIASLAVISVALLVYFKKRKH